MILDPPQIKMSLSPLGSIPSWSHTHRVLDWACSIPCAASTLGVMYEKSLIWTWGLDLRAALENTFNYCTDLYGCIYRYRCLKFKPYKKCLSQICRCFSRYVADLSFSYFPSFSCLYHSLSLYRHQSCFPIAFMFVGVGFTPLYPSLKEIKYHFTVFWFGCRRSRRLKFS